MITFQAEHYGPIAALDIPDGWQKQGYAGSSDNLVDFHPEGESNVTVSLFSTGRILFQPDAAAMREIISAPPHVLLPREVASLATSLRTYVDAHDFKILSFRTIDVGGRRAICFQGRWINHNIEALVYVFPEEAHGSYVLHEMHFKAPLNDFPRYSKTFKQILESVKFA